MGKLQKVTEKYANYLPVGMCGVAVDE